MSSTQPTAIDYAAQWREQLAARKAIADAERAAEPTAKVNLNGFEFIGRRINLQSWIRSGRLPQALLKQMLDAQPDKQSDVRMEELATEDTIAAINFQRAAVCESVVEPRIVAEQRPLRDGELSYMALCEQCPELIDQILQWVFAGSPGVPVRTAEGETSVETLNNFRDERPKRKPARPRRHVPDVRASTE